MADFQSIPINGTTEKLEKLLGMDIVEAVDEDSNDNQIPTAKAVRDAVVAGGNFVSYTPQSPTEAQQAQARQNIGVPTIKHAKGTLSQGESSLQEFESGTYILNGSFFYNRYTSDSVSFNDQYANISHDGDYTYLSYFDSKGSVVRTTLQGRLVKTNYIDFDKLESTQRRVDVIDGTSDSEHYPSAKAVYDYAAKIFVVEVLDGNVASADAGQVYEAVQNGCYVVMRYLGSLVPLVYSDEGNAYFSFMSYDDYSGTFLWLRSDAIVEKHDLSYVSQHQYEQDLGDINSALDSIIAIQESLIGGASE